MNKTLTSPDDKCVTYTCQDVNGDPMAKESTKICPEFNPDICTPVRVWVIFPSKLIFNNYIYMIEI